MHREGHIGIGLLLYAPVAYALTFYDLVVPLGLGLAAMVFWSYAPDFDMQVPFVSHRGITHTYLFAVVAGVLTAVAAVYFARNGTGGDSAIVIQPALYAQAAAAAFGFGIGFLGVISHLLGDILTPMGITPKHPFSKQKYSLAVVYAADERANKLLSGIGGVAFVGAFIAAELIQDQNINVLQIAIELLKI